MPAIEKSQKQEIIIEKISSETTEAMNCFQAREKLDALFNGDSRLEETHAAVKRLLFEHLEICGACCRAFDARVRFRLSQRARIY